MRRVLIAIADSKEKTRKKEQAKLELEIRKLEESRDKIIERAHADFTKAFAFLNRKLLEILQQNKGA